VEAHLLCWIGKCFNDEYMNKFEGQDVKISHILAHKHMESLQDMDLSKPQRYQVSLKLYDQIVCFHHCKSKNPSFLGHVRKSMLDIMGFFYFNSQNDEKKDEKNE